MRLLMIDNYDSFTYNLVQLFAEFAVEPLVFRHDQVSLAEIARLRPHWICVSPGPKDPAQAGISRQVVERFGSETPVLGVCLGMQVIGEVFGGRTARAPLPVHGKASRVFHQGQGIFAGLPSPFLAARYHSLQVILGGDDLEPLAWAEDGVLMGLRHRQYPIWGVQFHPESFFTQHGLEMARNFLALHPGVQAGPALAA
ncbi:MAG: aminodeoxychorismate/anthranilate synthase component II, partial [Desulfarculus sp.]|nr:aminodeoxychorismate/anthranilate synthase component II [Desulfarculus sp.]